MTEEVELTLYKDILVAELGNGRLLIEDERVVAILALDAPLLLGCGNAGHVVCDWWGILV